MDQKSLYELHQYYTEDACEYEYVLMGRDCFIVKYINSSVFAKCNHNINIAELSVGDGRLSMSILQSVESAELTCVDISEARIDSVRDRVECLTSSVKSRTHFLECNFDTQFNLLSDDSFDVVIALDIMEHVFDVFNFVEHCRRILKSEGTLILRVPNIAYIKHRLNVLFGGLPITASWFGRSGDLTQWRRRWGWDGGHLHLFTIPILNRLLCDYNFSVQLCRDPGTRFEEFRNFWPNLLYSNPVIIAKK